MTKDKQEDTMPTTFPTKWAKQLKEMPEFKEICDAASVDDLKKIIITSEGNISVVEKSKSEDVKLAGAKDIIKELSAPYKDSIKYQMCKIKYALFCLEGKGVEIGNEESE